MDNSQAIQSTPEASSLIPNQTVAQTQPTPTGWRRRLTYTAMSLFVAWHTLAIWVSPTPTGSGLVQSLRNIVQPYISFFRLDNQWSFFAPRVGRSGPFRYVVEAADGKRHVFLPMEAPRESVTHYFMWRELKYFYDKVMDSSDARGYLIAGQFCKQHAELHPVSVSLLRVQERDFSPEDYLEGYRPNDARFINVVALANIDC